MLLNIDPILTPQLLYALADMGHADGVAVVDANFTGTKLAVHQPVIRMPGLTLLRVCQAVTSVFPFDASVSQPIAHMKVCHTPEGHRNSAQQEVFDHLLQKGVKAEQIEAVERFAFYDRVLQCRLIVQTGEMRPYANYIFHKGVIIA
jgi:L-fucose mutarotase